MIFKTEQDLASFAENLGKTLKPPLIFELVGDVGAGKTTFTKHLAKGLGIKEPVTSPSFTISKHYRSSADIPSKSDPYPASKAFIELIHYDFYRLNAPGIMSDDLAESLNNPRAIVVLEWADSVKNILPKDHVKITFQVLSNASRKLTFSGNSSSLNKVREKIEAPSETHLKAHQVNAGNSDAKIRQTTNLYLDTSTATAIIKLEDEQTKKTYVHKDDLGRDMAEKLLETLKSHLNEHGKDFKDLAKITFMSGPGSFTGLRIGATIVNTLAHELDIPLYDHKGKKHDLILPLYSRPANITSPRK